MEGSRFLSLAEALDAAGRPPVRVDGYEGRSPSPPLLAQESGAVDDQRAGKRKRKDVCYRFGQTGKCKFGGECQFAHEAAGCIVQPDKYVKYSISWDEDEEEEAANMRRGLADTLSRARKGLGKMSEEPAHVPGTPITFVSRAQRQRHDRAQQPVAKEGEEPNRLSQRISLPGLWDREEQENEEDTTVNEVPAGSRANAGATGAIFINRRKTGRQQQRHRKPAADDNDST